MRYRPKARCVAPSGTCGDFTALRLPGYMERRMTEVLSVDNVLRIAESGEGFTLHGATTPLPDLLAIAAAAGRSKAPVRFRGVGRRPLEDLMRITVASQGQVTIEDDDDVLAAAPRRSWFGRRIQSGSRWPVAAETRHELSVQDRI